MVRHRPLLAAVLVLACGCGAPSRSGAARYRDGARGVSALVPAGWHATGRLTSLGFPREVVTLASFPLERGGDCGPDRALRDLPAGGALIFVLEYRPARGKVWTGGTRRSEFPPRPRPLRLPRRAPKSFECFARPGYLLRFRAANRPLQVMVALGPKASAQRRRTVERVLNGLRFSALPAPPPDPYAGWPTRTDESGDSLRAPPHWTSLVTAIPRRLPRPRTLFIVAGDRLSGLPAGRRRLSALPAPGVTPGLTQLAADAVVLWVTEQRRGGPSPAFPPLVRGRPWPRAEDFRALERGPAARWPALDWRRAGVSWRGLRFAAWIAAGRRTTPQQLARAEKAAASTALSSGLRDCSAQARRGACRRPLPRRLRLRRAPFLGVSCRMPNSIACDRVGLAVWLRGPARRVTATIDGRTFALRPPSSPGGYWEGFLQPAGLLRPGAALHVTPDRGHRWVGAHPVSAVVHLVATEPDGTTASRYVAVRLGAGYC